MFQQPVPFSQTRKPLVPLCLGQAQTAREVLEIAERAQSYPLASFIFVKALSGTGKSLLLEYLREPLAKAGFRIEEDTSALYGLACAARAETKLVCPILPGTSLSGLLPWTPSGEEPRWKAFEVAMRGFTKEELRPRLSKADRARDPKSVDALIDLSHGSLELLRALFQDWRSLNYGEMPKERRLEIALGFLGRNLNLSSGDLNAAQYAKFCSTYTSGEYSLPLDLNLGAFNNLSRQHSWLTQARRTSAVFRDSLPWERYRRIAEKAESGNGAFNEPGISIVAVANSVEDTRKLVGALELFRQERLEHEEGIYLRKSRVALFSAQERRPERGWSTAEDFDEMKSVEFPFHMAEPAAQMFLEIHTHEHYFEGKFLQLAALAESTFQDLRVPYYFNFRARNIHPLSLYYDPVSEQITPVSFAVLRNTVGDVTPVSILPQDTSIESWAQIRESITKLLKQNNGSALVNIERVLPVTASEYYRQEAPYIPKELEDALNRGAPQDDAYQVLSIEELAESIRKGTKPVLRETATTLVLLGYGSYREKDVAIEAQSVVEAIAAGRVRPLQVVVLGGVMDVEYFSKETLWGKGRFSGASLYELEFQRQGIYATPLTQSSEEESDGQRYYFWQSTTPPIIFPRKM